MLFIRLLTNNTETGTRDRFFSVMRKEEFDMFYMLLYCSSQGSLKVLSVSAGVVSNQGWAPAWQVIFHEHYSKGQCIFLGFSQFQAGIQQSQYVSLGFLKRQCCRVFKYSFLHQDSFCGDSLWGRYLSSFHANLNWRFNKSVYQIFIQSSLLQYEILSE